MATVLVKELIEAGVHFGHRSSRWNPKMRPYVYGRRNLIHVIDVRETIRGLLRARKYLQQVAGGGSLGRVSRTTVKLADGTPPAARLACLALRIRDRFPLAAGVPTKTRIDSPGQNCDTSHPPSVPRVRAAARRR